MLLSIAIVLVRHNLTLLGVLPQAQPGSAQVL